MPGRGTGLDPGMTGVDDRGDDAVAGEYSPPPPILTASPPNDEIESVGRAAQPVLIQYDVRHSADADPSRPHAGRRSRPLPETPPRLGFQAGSRRIGPHFPATAGFRAPGASRPRTPPPSATPRRKLPPRRDSRAGSHRIGPHFPATAGFCASGPADTWTPRPSATPRRRFPPRRESRAGSHWIGPHFPATAGFCASGPADTWTPAHRNPAPQIPAPAGISGRITPDQAPLSRHGRILRSRPGLSDNGRAADRGQSVSVTLRRPRGASGLPPRAMARC